MPVAALGFWLKPDGFFERNPAPGPAGPGRLTPVSRPYRARRDGRIPDRLAEVARSSRRNAPSWGRRTSGRNRGLASTDTQGPSRAGRRRDANPRRSGGIGVGLAAGRPLSIRASGSTPAGRAFITGRPSCKPIVPPPHREDRQASSLEIGTFPGYALGGCPSSRGDASEGPWIEARCCRRPGERGRKAADVEPMALNQGSRPGGVYRGMTRKGPVVNPASDEDKKASGVPASPDPRRWAFSFRFWRQTEFFGLDKAQPTWFVSLLERLAELSGLVIDDFRSDAAADRTIATTRSTGTRRTYRCAGRI